MKLTMTLLTTLVLLVDAAIAGTPWIEAKQNSFTFRYTASDSARRIEYARFIDEGIARTRAFMESPFVRDFQVVIHPDRRSLDSTWRVDWGAPDFTSECWMVASGVAAKLDLLSPRTWDSTACEHSSADFRKIQQLLTHELIHVFHGQHHPTPDFSTADGIDWFVEGLATYASGQCDSARMAEVRSAVRSGTTPASLGDFWKGKRKYGQSGSLVQYIDSAYGRSTLKTLLPLTTKAQILETLKTTEQELLDGWKAYIAGS